MTKTHLKKNDQVLVTAGRDRGSRGKVLRLLPSEGKAVVEGINLLKRHTRPNPQKGIQGGIIERPAPIAISNLKLICPNCGKPVRTGRERRDTGGAVRVCKNCGAPVS